MFPSNIAEPEKSINAIESSEGSRNEETKIICPQCNFVIAVIDVVPEMIKTSSMSFPETAAYTSNDETEEPSSSYLKCPFKFTSEEMDLLCTLVPKCLNSYGKVQWCEVAKGFENESIKNRSVFRRDKKRIESSWRNLNDCKRQKVLPISESQIVAPDAIQEPRLNMRSSSSTIPAMFTMGSSSVVTLPLSSEVPPVVDSSKSVGGTGSIHKKGDISAFEREKIRRWGLHNARLNKDITKTYLAERYRTELYDTKVVNYLRDGDELKNVWKKWWERNSNEYKNEKFEATKCLCSWCKDSG